MLKGIAVEDVFGLRTVSNVTRPLENGVRSAVCAVQVALSTVHAHEHLGSRTRGTYPVPISRTLA